MTSYPIPFSVETKQVDLSKLQQTRILNHPPPLASTLAAVDSKILTIETTPCFASCPVCKIVIHADGKLKFDGIMYTSHEGKKSLTADNTTATDVLTKTQTFLPPTGTETDNNKYHPKATDHSSYILIWESYSNHDQTKYHHYTGCHDTQSQSITQYLDTINKQPTGHYSLNQIVN